MLHQNWTKHIEQFSSTNLSHLYQNIPLSSTIISENLQLSDSYFTLVNYIGNVVGFINRYGGFNINSWYKILIIDDKPIGSVNNTNISYQNKNFKLHLKMLIVVNYIFILVISTQWTLIFLIGINAFFVKRRLWYLIFQSWIIREYIHNYFGSIEIKY